MAKGTPKTEKRFALIEKYLLRIIDRGRHSDSYDVIFKGLDYNAFTKLLYEGGLSDGKLNVCRDGHTEAIEPEIIPHNDWDEFIEKSGRENTPELLGRDIKIFNAMEDLINNQGFNQDSAAYVIESDWHHYDFGGRPLGNKGIKEIHGELGWILLPNSKEPVQWDPETGKDIKWKKETVGQSLRDAAVYAIREHVVFHGFFPVSQPGGIFKEIHRLLGLPFPEDIESEKYYFGRVKNLIYNHIEKRGKKTGDELIRIAAERYNVDYERLVSIYRDYSIIDYEIRHS
jgi:hypothetical protein